VFIVAHLGDGRAAEVLFESEGVPRDNPPSREAGKAVAGTFTIRSGKEGGGKGYLGQEEGAMTLGGQQQFVFDRQSYGEYGSAETVSTVSARDYKSASDLVVWEMSHSNEAVRESGGISSTLQQRMGTGGNQVPLIGIRRLTPTECERLQGFPDGWTDGQSDSARYRQLGNAVAVPVVEWIGRRIVAAENS
jgi:DNA (cytosine-5)-methyltransferase 1